MAKSKERYQPFYLNILDKPKIQALPPDAFKLWFNLILVVAESRDPDGRLPSTKHIAWRLRLAGKEKQTEQIIRRLIDDPEHHLIDEIDGVRYIHDWRYWQRRAKRPKRSGLSLSLRLRIANRDRWTCGLCGQPIPRPELHIDHIIPYSVGGSDDPENLQAAHAKCNLSKGDGY